MGAFDTDPSGAQRALEALSDEDRQRFIEGLRTLETASREMWEGVEQNEPVKLVIGALAFLAAKDTAKELFDKLHSMP